MAKRQCRLVVWLPTAIALGCLLSLLEFWWDHDYLETQTSHVCQKTNQPYFEDILLHITEKSSIDSVSHHDSRHTPHASTQTIDLSEIRNALLPMLSSFFQVTNHLGLNEAWIAHDVLLGHYFGQHLLPWKTNLDIQMSKNMMAQLIHGRYNGTTHNTWYPAPGAPPNQSIMHRSTSNYVLDVNPHWTSAITRDVSNKVDARWIDVHNGKFIDITVLHQDVQREQLYAKYGSIHPVSVCLNIFSVPKKR